MLTGRAQAAGLEPVGNFSYGMLAGNGSTLGCSGNTLIIDSDNQNFRSEELLAGGHITYKSQSGSTYTFTSGFATITVDGKNPSQGTYVSGSYKKTLGLGGTSDFQACFPNAGSGGSGGSSSGNGSLGGSITANLTVTFTGVQSSDSSVSVPSANASIACSTGSTSLNCTASLPTASTSVNPKPSTLSSSNIKFSVPYSNEIVGQKYHICFTAPYIVGDDGQDGDPVCNDVVATKAGAALNLSAQGDLSAIVGSSSSNDDTVDCGSESFDWLVCPVIKLALKGANTLDSFIMNQLNVDVTPIFDQTTQKNTPSQGYYTAWNSFRIIGTAILIIGGLIMVAAQAIGFEVLDAYTVRKVLPRLLVAIVGMSLSWPLMRLAVGFFDTAGFDIRALMYEPFKAMGGTISAGAGILSTLGVTAAIFVIGPAALTFVFTALLAVFVGFLIIIIRQVAIIMLIVLAPLAIACYILPNTQKAWKLWYDNFLGLLLMFPIISALIAAGHIFAAVTLNSNSGNSAHAIIAQGIAIVAYFVPYFLLPLAARMATGAIGTIAGMVNDRHKGAFDRLKGMRSNAAQQRHQMRMAGQTKFGGSRMGSLYRRGGLISTPNSGAVSMTRQGRANFQAAEQRLLAHTADEMLKNDNGRSAGDDLANSLALQKGMTGSNFISKYADASIEGARKRGETLSRSEAESRARASLAAIQSNYGATMGSSAMRVAAFKAKAASTTGYDGTEEAWEEREKDAVSLMQDGLITTTDAAAALKANAKRQDQAGVGFGDIMQQLESVKAGSRKWTNEEMIEKAMSGSQPGALLAGHKNAVAAAAPAMLRRLEKAYASGDGIEINRQLAEIAGRYDVMAQISPESARVMAKQVMAMPAGTTGTTVQDAIEHARGNSDFVTMRREYGSAERAAAAAAAGGTGGGYGPPGPPGIATPGS